MTRDNYLAGSLLVQMLVNYRNFLKKNIWCAQHLDFWEFQSNYVNFPCPRGLCFFFLAVSFPWSPGVTFQCFFTCKSPTPIYWINVTTIDEYRFSLASVFSNWGIFFFFLKCLTLMAKFEFFGMLTILRWSTERCVPGFWNCKNRFSNDRKFQRSRCADAARSGSRRNEILSENDFSNSFVFFFVLFQVHGTSRWPLPIGGQIGGRGETNKIGSVYLVAACLLKEFVNLSALLVLPVDLLGGHKTSHNTRRGRLVSLSSSTVRCGNYHRPWKKEGKCLKIASSRFSFFFMANWRGNVRFLCVDLTESSLKLIFKWIVLSKNFRHIELNFI